jgi:putative DNA methylase
MAGRPRVLIEDWLPVAELGIESRRERAAASALPPLSFLHVWWARRPLVASAGVILGSLLPIWTDELRDRFPNEPELRTDKAYKEWYLHLCGILGDPVEARRRYDDAVLSGVRIPNPYTYRQAFRNAPTTSDLALLQNVLQSEWGELPSMLDPSAGGGSIPYEAIRYGIPATANDLNPVAGSVLRASIEIPATFGSDLVGAVELWGSTLCDRVRSRLETYFPSGIGESVATYLFARTVRCPRTGKQVPLSPNWWLRKESGKEAAVSLVTERDGQQLDEIEFQIQTGLAARGANADRGTVAGGDAISPWDNLAIDGDYIKAEAQAARMGSQLFAVAIRTQDGRREFRAPNAQDLDALEEASKELERVRALWEQEEILPTEEIGLESNYDRGHRLYGIETWASMFSDRQLLVHGTFVEELRLALPDIIKSDGRRNGEGEAVAALLGLMVGKAVNWNAISSSWDVSRQKMRSVFDSHNFAFKWTFAEFEGARELYKWCLSQLLDAYGGVAELLPPSDSDSLKPTTLPYPVPGPVTVTVGTAGDLASVPSKSQTLICIDPPYYDNVMYAELSDFFYVWERRTVGRVWPEFFEDELTDKKNEAVANLARFRDGGKRKKELATSDYEAKMQAIFAECHRVLWDHGVMTVMFTHKRADAWDALGMALMAAGFTIENSWPVNTESEQSLHQAEKNAAASTIMLVCRKRDSEESGAFFEDLEPQVRAEARRALQSFTEQGIAGVDLLLATYGPALSVISSQWPVYSSEADPVTGRSRLLRPEEALDAARSEVTRIQRQRLIGRDQQLDPITDFVLVAWDNFKAREFPFDEARRLALAVGGLDVDELAHAKVLEKKSGTVVLLPPAKRVRREADLDAGLSGVYPEATSFTVAIDAVDTALHIADVDGVGAAKAFLDRGGLATDTRFTAALQGLVNAIPRTRVKGVWVVPEAETLDRLVTAYFPGIELPDEPEVERFEQESLLGDEG